MRDGTELDVRSLCAIAAALLCGVAVALILVILIGGSNNVASKSLLVAFFFALFTLPAAAGVYLARERPGLLWIGALTAVAAVAALIAVLVALWPGNIFESDSGSLETAAALTLVSIGSGQASLILGLGQPNDSRLVNGLRWAGLIPIAALTILGVEDISSHGPSASAKTYSVLGILYILAIVLPPLVARATRIEGEPAPPDSDSH
jgi:hypothetical protein